VRAIRSELYIAGKLKKRAEVKYQDLRPGLKGKSLLRKKSSLKKKVWYYGNIGHTPHGSMKKEAGKEESADVLHTRIAPFRRAINSLKQRDQEEKGGGSAISGLAPAKRSAGPLNVVKFRAVNEERRDP